MKTIFTLLMILFPVAISSQTAMSIQNLPDLNLARSVQALLVPTPDKYVVIGGHLNGFLLTINAEIFSTLTNTWQTITVSDNRDMAFVAQLSNGKYLIGGGCSSESGVGQLTTTEIYDPANNSFKSAASMNVARTNVSAATLKDGRVLVVGNWYNSADYAEIYDPTANTFTLTGACLKARSYPVIIPTDDGGAIVCGGIGIYGDRITDDVFEKYNPDTNSFTELINTLFDGETTWDIGCYVPTLSQQYKMANGKYAVIVYKTDYSMLRLISIDPATSEVKEITTQQSIPLVDTDDPSIQFGSSRKSIIDVTNNLMHIIQTASIPEFVLRIVTINLTTGSVNSSKMSGFDFNVGSGNHSMLGNGQILFTGGMITDNFVLSSRTFIITPATYLETNLNNPKTNNVTVRWDHSTQAFLFSGEVSEATLYNVNGTELIKSGKTSQLSAASIPAGVYFIRINKNNSGGSQILKIIKP